MGNTDLYALDVMLLNGDHKVFTDCDTFDSDERVLTFYIGPIKHHIVLENVIMYRIIPRANEKEE